MPLCYCSLSGSTVTVCSLTALEILSCEIWSINSIYSSLLEMMNAWSRFIFSTRYSFFITESLLCIHVPSIVLFCSERVSVIMSQRHTQAWLLYYSDFKHVDPCGRTHLLSWLQFTENVFEICGYSLSLNWLHRIIEVTVVNIRSLLEHVWVKNCLF